MNNSAKSQWLALGLTGAVSLSAALTLFAQTPAKPKTAAKPTTATKPAPVTPTETPEPSPKPAAPNTPLTKSIEALNAVLAKNTGVSQTFPVLEATQSFAKRGWKAEAAQDKHLLLSKYDIQQTSGAGDVTKFRRESLLRFDIPLAKLTANSISVTKATKKGKPVQRIAIAGGGSVIKVLMSNKTVPAEATNPDDSNDSLTSSCTLTFPDEAWTTEFVSKLKAVVALAKVG